MLDDIDEDDHDRRETEEQVEGRQLPETRQSGFAYCQQACGLSTEEVMAFLGLSRSAVEKKRSGERSMTAQEAGAFSVLWHDIRAFRVKDLPAGAVEMAYAMLYLTGRKAPEIKARGRKRLIPLDPAVEAEKKRAQNAAAMAAAIADIRARQTEREADRKAEREAEMAKLISSIGAGTGEAR